MVNTNNFNLEDKNREIIKEYQVYLLTEQHLLDNSIVSYTTDVYKYLEYMEKRNIKCCFDIKKDNLIDYLGYF